MKKLFYIIAIVALVCPLMAFNNTNSKREAPLKTLLDSLYREYPTIFGNEFAQDEFLQALDNKIISSLGNDCKYLKDYVWICADLKRTEYEDTFEVYFNTLPSFKIRNKVFNVYWCIEAYVDKKQVLELEKNRPYLIEGDVDVINTMDDIHIVNSYDVNNDSVKIEIKTLYMSDIRPKRISARRADLLEGYPRKFFVNWENGLIK